nr:hypothetical protein [Pandoravirus belohorizontensis]
MYARHWIRVSVGGSDGAAAVAHGDGALDAGVVGALRASGPPHCKRTRVPRPALASPPLASLVCATIFLDFFPFFFAFCSRGSLGVANRARPFPPFLCTRARARPPVRQTHTRPVTRLPSLAPLVLPPHRSPGRPPMGRGGTIPSRPSVRLHSLNASSPARPPTGRAGGGDPPTALRRFRRCRQKRRPW